MRNSERYARLRQQGEKRGRLGSSGSLHEQTQASLVFPPLRHYGAIFYRASFNFLNVWNMLH